jgi:hypothetical protein
MSNNSNFHIREGQYLSDTIRERPLPTPPLEDTMNSNLNNDSNLRSLVDNLFSSNRRDNTSQDIDDISESRVRSGPKRTDKDLMFTHMNNITYLLAKICEKVEQIDSKVTSVQAEVDKVKLSLVEQSKLRNNIVPPIQNKPLEVALRTEIDELDKQVRIKDDLITQKEEQNSILRAEIKAAAIDKDILLKLINQLVDNNSENLQIVERELKLSHPG